MTFHRVVLRAAMSAHVELFYQQEMIGELFSPAFTKKQDDRFKLRSSNPHLLSTTGRI